MWPGFTLRWRIGTTVYDITVTNPEHRCRGVRSATIDGATVSADAIPIQDDGRTHAISIEIGASVASVGVSAVG